MSSIQNPSGSQTPVESENTSESQNPGASQNPAETQNLGESQKLDENQNPGGRQISELYKIENEEDRLVSFSKRRAGIYKKASEISILCGAQIGIIILSPSEKVFTYGSPNIEAVVDRFCGRDTLRVVDLAKTAHEAQHNPNVQETNNTHNELAASLDTLKKEGVRITNVAKPAYPDFWWETPLEKLKPDEMEKLAFSMETIINVVGQRGETLMKIEADANTANVAGSSSNQ